MITLLSGSLIMAGCPPPFCGFTNSSYGVQLDTSSSPCQLYFVFEAVSSKVGLRSIHKDAFSRVVVPLDDEERGFRFHQEVLCDKPVSRSDVDGLVCPVGLVSEFLFGKGNEFYGLRQLVGRNHPAQIRREIDERVGLGSFRDEADALEEKDLFSISEPKGLGKVLRNRRFREGQDLDPVSFSREDEILNRPF